MRFTILFFYIISLSTYGQSSQELVEIKNQAKITLDAYINYLSYIGDKNEDFADRNQSYRKAFYQSFYSESDATLCYNDLDPEEKTSVYSSVKDYIDHVLHWYDQGLSTRFIGDYKFGQVATENGINYIPVFLKKEVRGNYMERRLHNKQYDLEFRLTYTRSALGSISNVKIASIKPASGGNSNNLVSAEELYKQAKQFYDRKEHTNAFPLMKQAAEKGNVYAQNNLGDMYWSGHGTKRDYFAAMKWYRKAAEKGNSDAQASIGDMYYLADGVTQDYAEAIKWYRKSALQGNLDAQINLALMYHDGKGVKQNYQEALKWYQQAASQGDSDSQFSLAEMYYYGVGTVKNYKEAIKWYLKAAQQENVNAQANLGYMYALGDGVTQDYMEAIKWYKKAAQKGDLDAQHDLGVIYENGYGVTKNIATAVEWYRKAARQDNDFAQKALTRLGYNW